MTTVEALSAWMAARGLDEEGDDYGTQLLPPLLTSEIGSLEESDGSKLTEDVRELLLHCGGLKDGPWGDIIFHGLKGEWGPARFRGRFKAIASDGLGNFWFYWKGCIGPSLGPVFYYEHELPAVVYQSDGIGDYVRECLRFMTPPHASLIDDVHEFKLRPTECLNADLMDREAAAKSGDNELAEFVENLPPDSLICDFRNAKPGDGINFQGLEIIQLHSNALIIAVRGKLGLFGWLRSRFVASTTGVS